MRKNGKKAFILGTDTHTWLRPLIRRTGDILAYLVIGPLMRGGTGMRMGLILGNRLAYLVHQ